jgi:hypothetical protein
MRKNFNQFVVVVSLATAVCIFAACSSNTSSEQKHEGTSGMSSTEEPLSDPVSRGKYLVMAGGCNDCHSPKIMTPKGPIPDTSKLLSGHQANSPLPAIDPKATQPGQWILMAPDITAFVGPWGISYPANLTSDSATGVGAWGEEAFMKTLRTGKHMGNPNGRDILPPMPWQDIGRLTDEDLKSIYAYLKSLPPINNRVPAPVPPNEVGKK